MEIAFARLIGNDALFARTKLPIDFLNERSDYLVLRVLEQIKHFRHNRWPAAPPVVAHNRLALTDITGPLPAGGGPFLCRDS